MLVSRNALQSYPSLSGENNANYFSTRAERDSYFASHSASIPEYVAIAENGEDPNTASWDAEIWQIEYYNGINWIAVNLSKNFALIVTNDGIKALTNASLGQYKLEISRILIKQTQLTPGEEVNTWTLNSFINSNGYSDICLDSNNLSNTSFKFNEALTYKTNLLNGGLQFTLTLDTKCMGQKSSVQSNNIPPTELDYNVSVIGLCVADQRSNDGTDILFAVANLPSAVQKVVTTPDQVGNTLKFYLNTTLSNFGNVVNLQTIKSSTNSIPEVTSNDQLENNVNSTLNIPYNIYLVDDYNETNIPALAIRKGNPVSPDIPLSWSYILPSDDTLTIDSSSVSTDVKNYMVVSWDPNNGNGKYVKTDSRNTTPLVGLYLNNQILYSGKIYNPGENFTYRFVDNNTNAANYRVGDVLTLSTNGISFVFTVTSVEESTGKPLTLSHYPQNGRANIEGTFQPQYDSSSTYNEGHGLTVTISSRSSLSNDLPWNFPTSWINKPLYADYNHNNGEPEGVTWNTYCQQAGIDTSGTKDRRGYLTCVENEYTISHFVGWCIDSNTVKLALDLRNEASYTLYGTTRYATHAETANANGNQNAYETTSVVPRNLKRNFFQITMPNTSASAADANLTNDGHDRAHAIKVDTYTTFTKSIDCTGTDMNGVAFNGTAYRALWADLAEYYRSDKVYLPGTLITIGAGLEEITEAKTECNGIISDKPGYILGNKKDEKDLLVALVGKVPVRFDNNTVPKFGDKIYLSKNEPGRASTIPYGKCLGKVIDKRKDLDQLPLVMCSVRIEFQ